jgi:uridine phosphorylase
VPEKLYGARFDEGDPLITPDAAVGYAAARAQLAVAELGVAPVVIAVWGQRLFDGLSARLDAAPLRNWWYGQRIPHVVGIAGEQPVSLVLLPVGAPGTVMIMEELIAAGARAFLGFGLAGSLQHGLGPGAAVLAQAAVRDEGTSGHYANPDEDARADESLSGIVRAALADAGIATAAGRVWTTDAPYRELRQTVARLRQGGVLAVDMETSAMYVLGAHREIPVANLLLISDVLSDPWHPAFYDDSLAKALEAAQDAMVQAASNSYARGHG